MSVERGLLFIILTLATYVHIIVHIVYWEKESLYIKKKSRGDKRWEHFFWACLREFCPLWEKSSPPEHSLFYRDIWEYITYIIIIIIAIGKIYIEMLPPIRERCLAIEQRERERDERRVCLVFQAAWSSLLPSQSRWWLRWCCPCPPATGDIWWCADISQVLAYPPSLLDREMLDLYASSSHGPPCPPMQEWER